jgi:hypothetical protein
MLRTLRYDFAHGHTKCFASTLARSCPDQGSGTLTCFTLKLS